MSANSYVSSVYMCAVYIKHGGNCATSSCRCSPNYVRRVPSRPPTAAGTAVSPSPALFTRTRIFIFLVSSLNKKKIPVQASGILEYSHPHTAAYAGWQALSGSGNITTKQKVLLANQKPEKSWKDKWLEVQQQQWRNPSGSRMCELTARLTSLSLCMRICSSSSSSLL